MRVCSKSPTSTDETGETKGNGTIMSTPDAAQTVNKAILKKIRALMKKTVENGCTQAEAETAAATVQRLMLRYNLNMQHIADAGGEREQYERFPITLNCPNGHYVRNHGALIFVIAHAHFCEVVRYNNSNRCIIIGQRSNAEIVRELYQSLSSAALSISEVEYLKYRRRDAIYSDTHPLNRLTWRRDFLLGFSGGLAERFERERKAAEQHGMSSTASDSDNDTEDADASGRRDLLPAADASEVRALVLVKDAELGKAVAQFFPAVKKSRPVTYRSDAARRAGRDASARVDIHRNPKLDK